ncbi:hypothetical protein KP509_03G099300 [Ceratopteris richardii]|uniref:RING-CH-type domain-containing protein n=1 Tax=Ceratopteris richardii TaxID=49495 RepID=A0A8T2V9M5_CERRI|nr:hypothetical protein KP509_03G099300 [Ceratopteris richardii]
MTDHVASSTDRVDRSDGHTRVPGGDYDFSSVNIPVSRSDLTRISAALRVSGDSRSSPALHEEEECEINAFTSKESSESEENQVFTELGSNSNFTEISEQFDEEATPLLKGVNADSDCGHVSVSIESGMHSGKKDSENAIIAECRICQEEDDVANLESPCACSGSLKYAHRKCIQHWCNEKGDIVCEICQKPFQGGYVAPVHGTEDDLELDIGPDWDIVHGQPRLFALAANHHFLEGDFNEHAGLYVHSAACFRSVALILVALLLLRHIIAMTEVGDDEDLTTFFMLSLVRAIGFLIPCYIMARVMSSLQTRHRQQEAAMAAAAEVSRLMQAGRIHGVLSADA